MAKAPNWTAEELNILKTEYPVHGCTKELLEKLPGRNSTGIGIKARRLGLVIENNPRKRRTHAEYVELLETSNFEVLGTYSGSTTPIKHRCKICNHEWDTRPQHALRENAHCPKCDYKNRCNSIEKVDLVLNRAGFERLSEYTGALDKITLKHSYCGHVWDTAYSHIQQGSGCPVCNRGFGYISQDTPESATLYLLRIYCKDSVFLKVGVTVQPIKKRINALKCRLGIVCDEIEILHTVADSGKNVLKKEAKILAKFITHLAMNKFEGHTECLSISNNIDEIIEVMNENI